ncbi:ComF family protein [Candidatus Omnitrophota bacterium]
MPPVSIFHSLVNVMIPINCAACGKRPASHPLPICVDCEDILLKECPPPAKITRHLNKIWSCRAYEGPLKECLKNFKYKGNRQFLNVFRALLRNFLNKHPDLHNDIDGIIPVPMHPAKRRIRGYNQSELVAEILAFEISSPILYRSLVKTRNTAPQIELAKNERLKNPEGSFTVIDRLRVAGKTLLLVDDIVTTGGTLEACAKELLKAGAKSITGLTLAETE